ncbi:MAG: hypothetical protein MRECE_30c026 [Mycoplasmataceae bacterium CE_OT135]|nr:MAG: hypothetical protein MRECE_30c026 [Mycoplasmataceae bacterium CE_OT135]
MNILCKPKTRIGEKFGILVIPPLTMTSSPKKLTKPKKIKK